MHHPHALVAPLEIGASDDEASDGGFSDDSLEDLSALLGRGRPNPAAQNLFDTPRAKRTATGPFVSPFKAVPKHKFDLKALAKDARLDNALNASSLKATASTDAAELPSSQRGEEFDLAFADIVKEKSGQDAHKVLRAVQRAEPIRSQTWYCFFDKDYKVPPSTPVPKLPEKSPWKLLTQGNSAARERNLTSGVPQSILAKNGGLPDSLFEWILDELCIERSPLIRREYCDIIYGCPNQVERLLTPERLEELFLRLGASEDIMFRDSEIPVSKTNHESYQDRDWSNLESFLALLSMISRHLPAVSAIYASHTLLRMSMDKLLIYNIDLLTMYEDAIEKLVNAIASSSWDSFCGDACSILRTTIKAQHIRVNALQCLPIRNARTHDLRRRLAISFLFDDSSLGSRHSEEFFTVRSAIDRLDKDDFNITSQTDFAELKAMIIILDIAVDDGCPPEPSSLEDEQQFNQDIDELATKLREIWRKINDSGMKITRTEAKSVIEWVQQRLSNTVRTRRKAKKSIFDLPGHEDLASLPKQQEYMAKFFRKIPKPQSRE
ncbi:uncharacterized protein TRIVIDRAFT_190842 [Trichoderma virens Gv29-8]|uniref:Uncharacterized protein n=1 Tax=Hypocrea virens (strain Gv29-8 / FGSC 10586) TaxID=413071 RepID=G9MQ05_HYPVG|nr:uncharacterized protein TRIVIDRAFT_190842 [Trichoderma virens Gv29-8]EHK23954.1 hypothetical protein TRIVIDRAFT_190842 [Trichoderma virens Gv29-8]UKZ50261.1 hypothetical protein TrVGV298_004518 [Trichoderma virens]